MKNVLIFIKYTCLVLFTLILANIIGGSVLIHKLQKKWKSNEYTIQNGCWRVNPKMDLANNPTQRASIALGGLFALRESEVLYFAANIDSDGNTLNSKYDYELVGKAPDARYWSFTMYGKDHYLVPNEAKQFGYNLETIDYEYAPTDVGDETIKNQKSYYQIILSNKKQAKNWLPSPKKPENFVITLRLYNPAPSVYNNLANCPLPSIRKINDQ